MNLANKSIIKQSAAIKLRWFHKLIAINLTVFGVIAGVGSIVSSPAVAQDENAAPLDSDAATQEQPVDPKASPETVAQEKKGQEKLTKKTLYFIGPKLRSERQQGPSIGAPISILPKPLVAKGSVLVPPPMERAVDTDQLQSDSNDAPGTEGQPGLETDLELATSSPLDGTVPIDTQLGDPLNDQFGEQLPDTDPDIIQAGFLERIDPSGLAVEGIAQPIDTVWQGYDRATIRVFLERLSLPTFSPTLTRLASSIAGSSFSLPAPSSQDDILNIIEARLAVFRATANASAYGDLLAGLPVDSDWSALAHHTARAHLLKGELTDACLIAEAERAEDTDPYWLRLAAFCMAAAGNRTGVDFQLGILEETTELDPVFYQLLDQILVEAEQPPGAVLLEPVTLDGALQADILTVAMARLARARIPEIASKGLDPLSIPLLLENPALSIEAQSLLVSYLIERGIDKSDATANFARSITLQDGELEAALAISAVADRAMTAAGGDTVDVAADSGQDLAAQIVDEDRLQTTLLAVFAGAGTHEQQLLAFNHLWQRAAAGGKQAAIAPVLAELAGGDKVARGDAMTADIRGYLARALMLSADGQAVNGWSRGLRTSVAGQDPVVDGVLISLWPLLALGEDHFAEDFATRLELWWVQHPKDPDGFKQANLLFSLTDAVGGDISDALWLELSGGPAVFDGVVISSALWRNFEMNVRAQDPLAALSSLYQLLGEAGPADLPPAVSGVLISGLMQLGFEDTARSLALEILISQKL